MNHVERFLLSRIPDHCSAADRVSDFLQSNGITDIPAIPPQDDAPAAAAAVNRFLGCQEIRLPAVRFLLSRLSGSVTFLFEINESPAVPPKLDDPVRINAFLESLSHHRMLTRLQDNMLKNENQQDECVRGIAWKLESYLHAVQEMASEFRELPAPRQTASEAVQQFRNPFSHYLLPLIDDLTEHLKHDPFHSQPMLILINAYLTSIGVYTSHTLRTDTYITDEQRDYYHVSPVFVSQSELNGLICDVSRLPYLMQYQDAETVKTALFPGAVSVLCYS